MNKNIYIVVGLLWIVRIVRNLVSYIQLWYIKEYRSDRMWIHLTKTEQAKKLYFPPFKKPPVSPKTVFLLGINLVSYGLMLLVPWANKLLMLLVIDLLSFPLVSFWVILLKLPTAIYHEILIKQAINKLNRHRFKAVIAVTGSFGKTSVKEFTAQILSQGYKTIKTAASQNSAIGIAEVVLAKLKKDTQIFVAEMGAYKKGEIAKMAVMVKPDIGIITAINAQHQDLFLSLGATMAAKYELIENLPKQGMAIFNLDNAYTKKLAHKAYREGRIVWCYTANEKAAVPEWIAKSIKAENIKTDTDQISFTVRVDSEKFPVTAKVLGCHQVGNILAAILASLAAGLTHSQIKKFLQKPLTLAHTMQPASHKTGAVLINDTFNNNPDAAKAAIDYLKQKTGKKILVFQPMIELGDYTDSAHYEVGAYAAQVCDEIYLTNRNFYGSFAKGVESKAINCQVFALPVDQIAKIIQNQITKSDTVLFKGKEADLVLKKLSYA